jgi:hypothetical protein
MTGGTGLERARLVLRGVRSDLRLEDGRMSITKEAPTPSEITFEVDRIRGTALDAPSPVGRGWIHIAVVEGTTTPASELAAMADPYTLPITARSTGVARRLARLVDKHLRERGLPSEASLHGTPSAGGRYSAGVSLAPAPVLRDPAVPEPPPPPPTSPTREAGDQVADARELVSELRQLAELHASGALTDEEFERAKARVIG